MRKLVLFLSGLFFLGSYTFAQLTVSPPFPTANQRITLTYDASKGNGALAGISPIYMQTGLLTTASATPDAWYDVQGVWGTADAAVMLNSIGNNKFVISFNIDSFYAPAITDTILALSFVFRNTDGSIVGRSADSDNINIRVYPVDSFEAGFLAPVGLVNGGNLAYTRDTTFNISAGANQNCSFVLSVNGNLLDIANGTTLNYNGYHFLNYGTYTFYLQAATATDTIIDSFSVLVNPPVNVQDPPAGTVQGINYLADSTSVILSLLAPGKSFVYVIGDFNNWQVDSAYLMNVATDGQTYWLQVSNLVPHKEYIFQYLVDGGIRIGDPYSDKVSDPNVDLNIAPRVYPGLITPSQNTSIASVLQTAQTAYNWQVTNFKRPAKTNLNIYEMFIPDFINAGTYSAVVDSLDYLVRLGINALELMPIENFEGDDGWGYNPNYFCAPEKIYGPQDSLRHLIDACHSKGLAVLLDIPFNDAFESNPMVMMYWDTLYQRPAFNNPWFNQLPTHPYSVGYDFNHESIYTKNFVKNVTRSWLGNYHVDGFRFDLTKGYTQFYSGTNVELWGEYDASRIAILEEMVDSIWAFDPTAITVFEHLSENPEEVELSSHGILLWGDENPIYGQAAMSYNNGWDLSPTSWEYNGWSQPGQVSYMESHDEERIMYENENYGDSISGYDIKSVDTALRRMEMAGTLFFAIPGPKMVYEFGELGFDYSINYGCRECLKPIKWTFLKNANRLRLYKVWSALMNLRNNYSTFNTTNYTINLSGAVKSIQLTGDFDAIAIGNFDVVPNTAAPGFQHTGTWYDYFSGQSINVTSTGQTFSYKQGEYHLYTDQQLPLPDITAVGTGIEDIALQQNGDISLYPNPNRGVFNMVFDMKETSETELAVYDLSGKLVYNIHAKLGEGTQNLLINLNEHNTQLAQGIYFYRLTLGQDVYNGKISVINN